MDLLLFAFSPSKKTITNKSHVFFEPEPHVLPESQRRIPFTVKQKINILSMSRPHKSEKTILLK
jgi:hypothetical protein